VIVVDDRLLLTQGDCKLRFTLNSVAYDFPCPTKFVPDVSDAEYKYVSFDKKNRRKVSTISISVAVEYGAGVLSSAQKTNLKYLVDESRKSKAILLKPHSDKSYTCSVYLSDYKIDYIDNQLAFDKHIFKVVLVDIDVVNEMELL